MGLKSVSGPFEDAGAVLDQGLRPGDEGRSGDLGGEGDIAFKGEGRLAHLIRKVSRIEHGTALSKAGQARNQRLRTPGKRSRGAQLRV